jgi:outer membrane cobalamin receptor
MRHSRVLSRKLCRRTGVARLQCGLRSILLTAVAVAFAAPIAGQEAYRSPSELKKLELEELVDVEITSASRRPEPLSQAASAIDVVTADEISRSGVTNGNSPRPILKPMAGTLSAAGRVSSETTPI